MRTKTCILHFLNALSAIIRWCFSPQRRSTYFATEHRSIRLFWMCTDPTRYSYKRFIHRRGTIVVCSSCCAHNNCIFAVRFQPECRFAECVTSHLFDYNYGWRFQQLLQPHISYHSNVSPQKLIFIFTFIATIELNWFAVISNYHNNSFFIHTLWLSSFVIGQLLRWARTLSKVSRSMIM